MEQRKSLKNRAFPAPALSGNLLIAYYVAVDFEQKGGGSVTSEQLPQLAALVKNGAPGATLELWNGVHLFIEREARRYAAAFAGQTTPEDLTQTGYFAMLDAADIYDEGRGASFLKALRFCLQKRFAEEVGVRSSRRDALQYAASADAPAYQDDPEGPTVGDMTEDEGAALAFVCVEYEDLVQYSRRLIVSAFCTLPEKQRDLLTAYFFAGCALHTAAELSGYSCKQAAFDGMNRALRYLRRGSHSRQLRACLDAFEDFEPYLSAAGRYGIGTYTRTGMSATEAAAIMRL